MIVTCEACSTSFQLDESRIPAAGARVRCSKCKHAFLLLHPSSTPERAAADVHQIAAETAADEAAGTPAASADLATDRPASAVGSDSARLDSEPEEEDWQFNQEIRVAGDDEHEEGLPASDFDAASDFGEGFDGSSISIEEGIEGIESSLESDSALEPRIASSSSNASEIVEEGRDESDFGSVDDFSSWMEDDDSASEDSDLQPSEVSSDAPGRMTAPAGVAVHALRGDAEDLGDPESWDLIGADGAGPTPGVSSAKAGAAKASARRGASGPSVDFLDGFAAGSHAEELDEPSAWLVTAARLGGLLGWGITIALIAASLYAGLQPEWARWSEATQRVEAGAFQAVTVDTGWVETSRVGTVLVVRGQSYNAGSEPLWPSPVQVALLDGRGLRLALPPVRAGEPLAESLLREGSVAMLESARSAAVEDFLGIPLAPGEVRRFEAVWTDVPVEARRTQIEIGSPLQQAPALATAMGPGNQLERVEDSSERLP